MASEAQRIMNLSLTKIVSSRGRRGGPSLRRNLLLASVLFRARDVYAAEMAGLVLRTSLPVDTPDMPDLDGDDDSLVPDDHRIQEAADAAAIGSNPVLSRDPLPGNASDESRDVDMGKENVRPKEANDSSTATDSAASVKQSKRKRKSPNRKRKLTETEQAVLGIAEESTDSPKKLRCEDNAAISLDCSESPATLTDRRIDQTPTAAESQINRDMTAINHSSNSSVAYSSRAYDDDYDDKDDDSNYDDASPYRRHVNSAASDSFSLLLSHPVLVVSV